ncbi:hypothetical protein B0O99DRAFT_651574 [Bisporella sp. PMI_857]|nr:hypothetical protein B0O99DRAFT_651574 [Bisporella sp. PMI_857]
MKYGQVLQAQSLPKWAPYNVDYNELKNLIKVHTTKNQGAASAIAIPGQINTALAEFEELFYNELRNQHDRVDLFVKDKYMEIDRRLDYYQTTVVKLLARLPYNNGRPMTHKKRKLFGRYDTQIENCGEDTRQLQRFVGIQRVAFHKILKKYRKWTGSPSLSDLFNTRVLGSPESFTKRDFEPLLRRYRHQITQLRENTPDTSETPTPQRSRRASTQIQVIHVPQPYWNEYDHGSDAGDEPYLIQVDPNVGPTFPGAKTVAHILSIVPIEKVKKWMSPQSSPDEQRPLLADESGGTRPSSNSGYFGIPGSQSETDVDDDAYASSNEFPSGYATHYSTFPSVQDQKFSRYREMLLFRGTLASFIAAIVLLLIASILISTGKHKLRVEVDAGAIVGIVTSLFFATLGLGMMLYRTELVGWVQRISVVSTFTVVCIINGVLLVLVVGNSDL